MPLGVKVHGDTSGIVAVLNGADGSDTGRVALLRADMDALPLTERTGLSFAALRRRQNSPTPGPRPGQMPYSDREARRA